ncbi:MAG: putative transcriptional regulator, TetR family [Rubritepida sp.]|nr:putative transcriptional regulator, TetR family [Rubritepida sp.]
MAPTTQTAPRADTSARILAEAQRLVQTRGFNGFSYADIAAALGVTKASLHYHFPSKAELGRRLIDRYREHFLEALRRIDESGAEACGRLHAYIAIYERVLADDRMCLCGMLAAEYATLPGLMRDGLRTFFQANEDWLARLLAEGRAVGELDVAGDPREAANALTGALEGAMLVARAHGSTQSFRSSATLLIASVCGTSPRTTPAAPHRDGPGP